MDEAGRSTLAPARLPLPIRAMNRMGPLLARARVFPARLEPEALLDEAARAAGCDDFGPDEFREGYERLVASLEGDAALTPFGRFFAKRQLMELLTQRLALVDWRKRHPEVARDDGIHATRHRLRTREVVRPARRILLHRLRVKGRFSWIPRPQSVLSPEASRSTSTYA